jgi:hypothetical protein
VPILKPRERAICFRVSEDEYERLTAACDALGVRSLSEFVRSGICWIAETSNRCLLDLIATAGQPVPPSRPVLPFAPPASRAKADRADPVRELDRRLDLLTYEVRFLSQQLNRRKSAHTAAVETRTPARFDEIGES